MLLTEFDPLISVGGMKSTEAKFSSVTKYNFKVLAGSIKVQWFPRRTQKSLVVILQW